MVRGCGFRVCVCLAINLNFRSTLLTVLRVTGMREVLLHCSGYKGNLNVAEFARRVGYTEKVTLSEFGN